MSILQSVESFFAAALADVKAILASPEVAPFIPLAEAELEQLAEGFALAHGVSVPAAQNLITDALNVMAKRTAEAKSEIKESTP